MAAGRQALPRTFTLNPDFAALHSHWVESIIMRGFVVGLLVGAALMLHGAVHSLVEGQWDSVMAFFRNQDFATVLTGAVALLAFLAIVTVGYISYTVSLLPAWPSLDVRMTGLADARPFHEHRLGH
jgi:hypothetical protein